MAVTQVLEVGSELCLNAIAGNTVPVVAGSAPTWVPGLYWIDSGSAYAVKTWNGTSWVAAGSEYLALATSDPTHATDMTGIIEVLTSGYTRQAVTWTAASAAYPSVLSNSATITWGPMTADMLLPADWVVLVTTASGATGFPLYAWQISPQQVSTSQNIQIATGALTLSQS
jgi:hypothetical protein